MLVKEADKREYQGSDRMCIPQEGDEEGGVACAYNFCVLSVLNEGGGALLSEEVDCLLSVRGGGAIKYGVPYPGGSAIESGVLIGEGVEVGCHDTTHEQYFSVLDNVDYHNP